MISAADERQLLATCEPPRAASRRLRVCHLSLGLATGGLERLLVDFAKFHDRAEFEMSFAALHELGRPAEDISAAGCAVHSLELRGRGRWQCMAGLTRLFCDQGYDVVHTHNAFPHLYGTAAARWARVPVVVHTRHGQRFGHGCWANAQFRLASRWVDRVVAVSEDARRLCCAADRIPPHKVARIWNGIDLDRFAYQGPASGPYAICVARLSAEKDFGTLIRAAGLAAREIAGFRLQIVGGGGERERLEALVRELHLEQTVQLLGERSDIPALLAKAGLFVTSSLTEGVSLTLLEAMAVGLPVLATAVGGNPEVVADGVTGRLVPPGDPHALAAALIRMWSERDSWPAQGRQGRARVAEHFEARRMVRDYESLYAELSANRQRAVR